MTKIIVRTNVIEVLFIGFLATGIFLVPQTLFSQVEEEELEVLEKVTEELEEAFEEIEEEAKEVKVKVMGIPILELPEDWEDRDVSPRLGLYLNDVDFQDAYERHYPENYGVLIDGIVRGGNGERAGLREGDIIMEFNGEQVRYEDHLLRMRNSKVIGDTVKIKFFRDEKVMTTNLTFYPPVEVTEEGIEIPDIKRKGLSSGYGGGGIEPVIINFDFDGINRFLDVNGFDKIKSSYVVAFGGGGMGNVGKGWFIGGMGAGFEKRQQINVKDSQGVNIGTKMYRLESGFGGVTLAKKIPLLERLILDASVMLGGGNTLLRVSQTDGDITWGDNISEKNSYSVHFQKSYFACYPSVGLLVRIKNWVGVHGSVGYLGTYATDDKWTEKPFDFTVGGVSPAVPSGISYTIGFWFGH